MSWTDAELAEVAESWSGTPEHTDSAKWAEQAGIHAFLNRPYSGAPVRENEEALYEAFLNHPAWSKP